MEERRWLGKGKIRMAVGEGRRKREEVVRKGKNKDGKVRREDEVVRKGKRKGGT